MSIYAGREWNMEEKPRWRNVITAVEPHAGLLLYTSKTGSTSQPSMAVSHVYVSHLQ
jgi:hypothetical protein